LLTGKEKTEQKEIVAKLLADNAEADNYLSYINAPVFKQLPDFIKKELLIEREATGSIRLSQIETERLLGEEVDKELKRRKKEGTYGGSFSYISHFFGYQGRSSMPTIFDCSLASTYGFTAAALVSNDMTGYMLTARGLSGPPSAWKVGAIPIVGLM
jgi:pyrophosphate--fructose-6-phosphate 1-phosphotransferase